MREITATNRKSGAILAFILVPLSGLATDLYLPSFPNMASVFQVNDAAIQLTLSIFLISYGLGQFFAGAIMDSFGRYRPTLLSLVVFFITNILIVTTKNIHLIYIYRVLQGISVAFIAIAKRTFFVDEYTGEQQRSYTALLTIVWGVAPLIAPFLGGYLQEFFNWKACFYFLAAYSLILLVLELKYSGETMKEQVPFKLKTIFRSYSKILNTSDFSAGVTILGISFCMVITFNMVIPFIIEHNLGLSSVVTGYCALFSGLSLLMGGVIGKQMTVKNLLKKSFILTVIQVVVVIIMLSAAQYLSYLILLMFFVVIIHTIEGIIFNFFFTHCLTRFPHNAASAGGITAGGNYIVVSVISTLLLTFLVVNNQKMLAICYLLLSIVNIALLLIFNKAITKANMEMLAE